VKSFPVLFKTKINVGDLAVYSEKGQKINYSILFLEPAFWIVSPRVPESASLRDPKVLYLTFGTIEPIHGLSPLYRIFRANSPEEVTVPRSTWGSSLEFTGFVTESFFHKCVISEEYQTRSLERKIEKGLTTHRRVL